MGSKYYHSFQIFDESILAREGLGKFGKGWLPVEHPLSEY